MSQELPLKVGAFCLEEQKVIDVIKKKQGKERSNIRQIKRKKSDWFNIYFMKNFRSPVSLCKSLPSKRRSWLPLILTCLGLKKQRKCIFALVKIFSYQKANLRSSKLQSMMDEGKG